MKIYLPNPSVRHVREMLKRAENKENVQPLDFYDVIKKHRPGLAYMVDNATRKGFGGIVLLVVSIRDMSNSMKRSGSES